VSRPINAFLRPQEYSHQLITSLSFAEAVVRDPNLQVRTLVTTTWSITGRRNRSGMLGQGHRCPHRDCSCATEAMDRGAVERLTDSQNRNHFSRYSDRIGRSSYVENSFCRASKTHPSRRCPWSVDHSKTPMRLQNNVPLADVWHSTWANRERPQHCLAGWKKFLKPA